MDQTACSLPARGDALVIVDVQRDFLPGGRLAVPAGDAVIPALNLAIDAFGERALPIIATRDWHPANHCSFVSQGGPWPAHCIAGSTGADFPQQLRIPATAIVMSKATQPQADAYSGFDGTGLAARLRSMGIRRIVVGGLATDYCVLATVRDALTHGLDVVVLLDAVRAVNRRADDGVAALDEMAARGAVLLTSQALQREVPAGRSGFRR